jgi:hypothetical protein
MENDNDNEWHHTPLPTRGDHYVSTGRHVTAVTKTINNHRHIKGPSDV